MAKNNESFGVAAEVAIAKTFGVKINPAYAMRAEETMFHLIFCCLRADFPIRF